MSEPNFIEVALAADRNYIIGLTVAAYSIACNCNADSPLRFHLLISGFSEKDKEDLRGKITSAKQNSTVCFYDVAEIDFSFLPLYASSRMTYARLILPEILKTASHVIYADVDMLWLDDIADLWSLKDEVDLVSCVREQSRKTISMEEAWFTSRNLPFDRSRYFCAGVSFYNLEAIRESGAFKKVFDFGAKYPSFNCADQSMLYGAIGEKVKLLPDRWQTFPRNGITAEPGEPVVLHYAGEAPWKCTNFTCMITDTQLLWFMVCAIVYDESVWKSLRRFYSPARIILSRIIFVSLFKIWPATILSKFLLRKLGVENFNEKLSRRSLYIKRIHDSRKRGYSADSSSAAI